MDKIFISYSRQDGGIAKQLVELLRESFDNVWYDRRLNAGDPWEEIILSQVRDCDHFIFLMSNDSLDSEWCQREYVEAVRCERHIVPVMIRPVTNSSHSISHWQILDMTGDGITIERLNRLYAALIRRQMETFQQRILFEELKQDFEEIIGETTDTDTPELPGVASEPVPEPAAKSSSEPAPRSAAKNKPVPSPVTVAPNGVSIERSLSQQLQNFLPSFIGKLEEWDDEPWRVVWNVKGAGQHVLGRLNDAQQRQLYDVMHAMLKAAHQLSAEHAKLLHLLSQWFEDIYPPDERNAFQAGEEKKPKDDDAAVNGSHQ